MPNWAEAAAIFWAVAQLGATLIPIVHFYGTKELSFILRQSGARAFLCADRFRNVDYLSSLGEVTKTCPDLELVAVLGKRVPSGVVSFDNLTTGPENNLPAPTDPNRPAIVAYTSGTTADPKGVIHTHQSFVAETMQLASIQAVDEGPSLVGAPAGHFIGMLAGLFLPIVRGFPIHLTDVWNPGAVLRAVAEAKISAGSGAAYFLTSLIDHPDFGPEHLKNIRYAGLGGAPVPAAVADRAHDLGISVIRSYGSSEQPSITGSSHSDPPGKRMYTDGGPLPGVEIRLIDEAGKAVGPGVPGEILSRGPELFSGYTDAALTRDSFDDAGWYATGDIGILNEHGWLTITDRKKDIIIRGGENISAGEVEELLARLPGVLEVAVVAAPDPRMGEHGCAFVRANPHQPLPDLEAVRRHLETAGLARKKWPEEVRVIEDFPRTPAGKIKKVELRDRLRQEAQSESDTS
jgi:acyl-CoA synthetase (AMP-forming)/AMP-acid ligase II